MKPRASPVALALWGVALLLAAGALGLIVTGPSVLVAEQRETILSETTGILAALAASTVGAIISLRLPRNPIGWIFCAAGIVLQVENFGGKYAAYTLVENPGALPGGAIVALLADAMWLPSLVLGTIYLFLLFPDGHLLSARWRWVLVGSTVAALLSIPATLLSPDELYYVPQVRNPWGMDAIAGFLEFVWGFSFVAILIGFLLALASLLVRVRRSSGVEREQMKWFLYAALVVLLAVLPTLVSPSTVWSVVFEASFAGIPIAVGVAILRYRLYDIDRVINRTIVYGAVTALLALAYFGVILAIQGLMPVSEDSPVAVAASTLAVVALFRPLRARIQDFVDRRFYRRKFDSARTIDSFAARLRSQTDLESLTTDLLKVVGTTMQPRHASLWLRSEKAR